MGVILGSYYIPITPLPRGGAKDLTGITQDMVDKSASLEAFAGFGSDDCCSLKFNV